MHYITTKPTEEEKAEHGRKFYELDVDTCPVCPS